MFGVKDFNFYYTWFRFTIDIAVIFQVDSIQAENSKIMN